MSNTLQHHGIVGQKWGVRRYQNADGTLTAAGKKHQVAVEQRVSQKQSEREKIVDFKKRGTLSDADLQKKINRLKMEKELRQLTDEEVRPGKAFVKSVMTEAGKRALTTALTGAFLFAGKSLVDGGMKSYDSKQSYYKDFGSAIFNGGPKKK
jgi:hypothetical protein